MPTTRRNKENIEVEDSRSVDRLIISWHGDLRSLNPRFLFPLKALESNLRMCALMLVALVVVAATLAALRFVAGVPSDPEDPFV